MLKQVPIGELQPGMMVTRVIEQNGPVKIRRVGLIKSDAMVKGLTEMGVSLLEVDEAQSFTLELDTDEQNTEEDGKHVLTPTQSLMAKDKQSAVVDRQLSQQFNRSLFMPAIDEMPSKWRLYFRPYAMLFASVVTGFALGFLAIAIFTQASLWVKGTPQSVVTTPQNESAEASNQPNSVNASMQAVTNAGDNAGQTTNLNSEETKLDSTSEPQGQNDKKNTASTADIEQNREQRPAQEQNNDDQNSDNIEPEQVRTLQTINGIVLNEGETVLGYGGEDSQNEVADDSNTSNQNNVPSSAFSSNLLNRVNRAAAQLEAEQDADGNASSEAPTEPLDLNALLQREPVGPVVDLRAPAPQQTSENQRVVRIDQLPAAVLTQMPAMSFSAHMFASNPQDRWVRVNGRRLSEGDFIVDGLSIVEIQSERIILAFKGETFSMNALSDW